jgi:hypothetical protein
LEVDRLAVAENIFGVFQFEDGLRKFVVKVELKVLILI